MIAAVMRALDRAKTAVFNQWAATPHGNERLVAFHDAVIDADDTLEAVNAAILDGDYAQASHLIALGRESLAGRIQELKGML